MTRITLRAKSDGTEISGELALEEEGYTHIRLAPNTSVYYSRKDQWDRVYVPPTTPGTVFRATVRGVENVRVMATEEVPLGGRYSSAVPVAEYRFHSPAHIDASTVVIELEGDDG